MLGLQFRPVEVPQSKAECRCTRERTHSHPEQNRDVINTHKKTCFFGIFCVQFVDASFVVKCTKFGPPYRSVLSKTLKGFSKPVQQIAI